MPYGVGRPRFVWIVSIYLVYSILDSVYTILDSFTQR